MLPTPRRPRLDLAKRDVDHLFLRSYISEGCVTATHTGLRGTIRPRRFPQHMSGSPPTDAPVLHEVLRLLSAADERGPEDLVFRLENIMTSNPDVNMERIMLLHHVVSSLWSGTIRVSLPVSTTEMATQSPGPPENDAQMVSPSEDVCYALGRFNFKDMWFKVKVIGHRQTEPRIRVLYLARLDGESRAECLPSPRRDYVHVTQHEAPDA